jgi:hypothetical protein
MPEKSHNLCVDFYNKSVAPAHDLLLIFPHLYGSVKQDFVHQSFNAMLTKGT